MGHEIVADVVEVGAGARGRFREGDRVVVDPVLPCLARGLSPCARCVEGDYAVCERLTDAPGAMLGASAQVPGGFAERIVAHASQLFAVPSAMQDEVAALVEPLTVAVRAVLRHGPRPGERVLVVGGGTIAFAVLWAIHELCRDVSVSAYALEPYQLDIARRMGADAVLGEAPPHDLLHAAAADTGSRVLHPMLGRGFLAGGYDRVFDCVGTQQSVDDVLRVTRPGGTVVMVGTPGVLPGLDLTFLWVRQLRVEGTVYYGFETWRGERARTFDVTLDLLRTTAAPLAELVTHKLPLDRYAEAIEASVDRRGARSVKAVLAP
jgi:threonine dehydrogenase-like Zn-dependent dehydrogenase